MINLKIETNDTYLKRALANKKCVIDKAVKKLVDDIFSTAPEYVGHCEEIIFNDTVKAGTLIGMIGDHDVIVTNHSGSKDIHVKIEKGFNGGLRVELRTSL